MSETEKQELTFANDMSDALVAYLIGRYREVSSNKLGRTILQKLCYFAEASGVPLGFGFGMYHYGPFSVDVFKSVDALLLDDVIKDESDDPARSNYEPGENWGILVESFGQDLSKYEGTLDTIARTFCKLDPSQMELVSTIHYVHNSHREWSRAAPSKEEVVDSVLDIKKEKFEKEYVGKVYDILSEARLLRGWEGPAATA